MSYNIFQELMEKYTADYGCLVADLKNGGIIYYYR